MRNSFAKKITELAKKNNKIILLSGDIGNRLFDEFKQKCPNQFYNCGVAENNMIGVASGLSKLGFIPFVYTITPFLVSRSFEQIKLDVAYPNLNVTIVGTGAGLSYARLGTTHHSLDDLMLMKSLPNMKLLIPGDPLEVETLLEQKIKKINNGPTYLRLGKKGEPIVNKKNKKIKLGSYNQIFLKGDILILCVGNVLGIGNEITKKLLKKNIKARLISFHSYPCKNLNNLKKEMQKSKKVLFIEEHFYDGSISSYLVNEFRSILNKKKVIHCNIKKKFYSGLGEQVTARDFLNLSANKIMKKL